MTRLATSPHPGVSLSPSDAFGATAAHHCHFLFHRHPHSHHGPTVVDGTSAFVHKCNHNHARPRCCDVAWICGRLTPADTVSGALARSRRLRPVPPRRTRFLGDGGGSTGERARVIERIARAGARDAMAAECEREETGEITEAKFSEGVRWDASRSEVPALTSVRREHLPTDEAMGAVIRLMGPSHAARWMHAPPMPGSSSSVQSELRSHPGSMVRCPCMFMLGSR
jgi:hypothetical protein